MASRIFRLTLFTEDDGSSFYLGSYTAYSGQEVGCEMLSTLNFTEFQLAPLHGAAAQHKGLALFPRRIDGRFAAIHRLEITRACTSCAATTALP